MSMSDACRCSADCTCGACRGLRDSTPLAIDNRPGLSSIRYRVGDHARFKASMLTALSRARLPALRGLTTRRDDDFAVAFLDDVAVMADIYTFYQERIAHESFLRTARERLSVGYLAKLIGYELRPGCAANVSLAFQMMEAPGLPKGAPGLVQKLLLPVGTRVQSTPGPEEKPQLFETVEELEVRPAWNAIPVRTLADQTLQAGMTELLLKGSALNLKAGDGLLLVFPNQGASDFTAAYRRIQRVEVDARADLTRAILQAFEVPVTYDDVSAEQTGVFVFRRHASLFGYNAPQFSILNAGLNYALSSTEWEASGDWNHAKAGNAPGLLNLDAVYRDIVPGSWGAWERPVPAYEFTVVKVNPFTDKGFSAFGLTGKATNILVTKGNNVATTLEPGSFDQLRSTTLLLQSERLELAQVRMPLPVQGNTLDFALAVDGLEPGRRVAISGKQVTGQEATVADVETVELAVIATVDVDGEGVTLKDPLMWDYHPPSVRINANVVAATHGESVGKSVKEVFEGGDATQVFQRFALKQTPLTYVSATTPSGTSSTLRVWVEEVEWHEAAFLYGHGPKDRVFITRMDGDGKTWIQFGDGVTGARLPTGPRNVRAEYRRGVGSEGNLEAGQINLLMSRPLGLKDALNPLPSSDGKDPETLEDARANATLGVLTLDRVVSLQDYEDFARAFGGVAKAAATWTWFGQTRGVFITVAGAGGGSVSLEGRKSLRDAIAAWGDPYVPVRVENHTPVTFLTGLRVRVVLDYQAPLVLEAVEVALRAAFAFERRAFGQDISAAEVTAVAQAVAGVVAVQVASLHLSDDTDTEAGLAMPLLAGAPLPGERGSVFPGELLTLDPAPLELLEEME